MTKKQLGNEGIMDIFDNSDIDRYIITILVANIAIALFLTFVTLFFHKKFCKKTSFNEIDAMSISAKIISLVIIMTGINNTEFIDDILKETMFNFIFTIFSLFIIYFSQVIFKKLFTSRYNMDNKIPVLNFATAISTSISIRSLIIWADGISITGIKYLLTIYFMIEIINILIALIYLEITKNNQSINNYASYRVSTSLVLASVLAFIPYDIMDNLWYSWIKFASIIIILFMIFTYIIKKIIKLLCRFDSIKSQEIIDSSIVVGLALLISSLIW